MDDNAVAAHKAQVRATFDRVAPQYGQTGPGAFAHFGRRLVEMAGLEPGQRVLDVAAGRGAVLFPAEERVGPTGEVVGVDLSAGMVQAANAEAEKRGVRVRVQEMDAEHLGFPDGAFDAILCGFGLMFFPARDRALGEFRRVLRPGGRVGVSTWHRSQTEDLAEVLRGLGLASAREPGWITEPDELRHLLEGAEFRDVQMRVDEATFRYAGLGEYWETARGTGLGRYLAGLDDSQTDQVRRALAEQVGPYQDAEGLQLPASALVATGTC